MKKGLVDAMNISIVEGANLPVTLPVDEVREGLEEAIDKSRVEREFLLCLDG